MLWKLRTDSAVGTHTHQTRPEAEHHSTKGEQARTSNAHGQSQPGWVPNGERLQEPKPQCGFRRAAQAQGHWLREAHVDRPQANQNRRGSLFPSPGETKDAASWYGCLEACWLPHREQCLGHHRRITKAAGKSACTATLHESKQVLPVGHAHQGAGRCKGRSSRRTVTIGACGSLSRN